MIADLMLESSVLKGIALAGVLSELESAGYAFERIAGSSGGAIVAALVAAGLRAPLVVDLMEDGVELRVVGRSRGESPEVYPAVYDGRHLAAWVGKLLEEAGAARFGDLRIAEGMAGDLPGRRRYRLVLLATDLRRRRVVRLPWDYRLYGLDPDQQPVAGAVQAAMATPFLFQPVPIGASGGDAGGLLVDAGLSSDFPIELFDRTDGEPARWPTFGVKVRAESPAQGRHHVTDLVSMTHALIETAVDGGERVHLADPSVTSRTIFVDSGPVTSAGVAEGRAARRRLADAGRVAALDFVASWDWEPVRRASAADPGRLAKSRAASGEWDLTAGG
jgi:NTE family protein